MRKAVSQNETRWIYELCTLHPQGMNLDIDLKCFFNQLLTNCPDKMVFKITWGGWELLVSVGIKVFLQILTHFYEPASILYT